MHHRSGVGYAGSHSADLAVGGQSAPLQHRSYLWLPFRVAPNFGFGKFEIRPFFPNSASAKFLAEFGRDANATAVSYLITDNN